MKSITILSGGLDSTVLAYYLAQGTMTQDFITFDYGQRHVKEIEYARVTAQKLGGSHRVIDLSTLYLKGNSLTDRNIEVPDGDYDSDNMKVTVVPNRNAIMLMIAGSIAESEKANFVSLGVHAGDHYIYKDCRMEFVDAVARVFELSLDSKVKIFTPFITIGKSDIVHEGHKLHVPFEDTWSCYKGGEKHCGKCGTCQERKQAFKLNRIKDPTIYEE